jgi:hypothetical protein
MKRRKTNYRTIEVFGVKARQAPIRSTLTERQLERIRKIHFSEFTQVLLAGKQSLEECKIDFMRDTTPDREIVTWEAMAETYSQYLDRHPKADRLAVARRVQVLATYLRPIQLDSGQLVGPSAPPPGSSEIVELFETALLKERD